MISMNTMMIKLNWQLILVYM